MTTSCPTPSPSQAASSRITELNTPGMVWGSRDAGYRIGVDHLRAYTAAEGHANVPRWYVTDDGFKLGSWVVQRRHDRKVGRLSTAKVTEMDSLGMAWNPLDANYRIGLDHLQTYTAAEGHADVPRKFVADGFKLGVWVGNRRIDRRVGRLSPSRTAELNALGMMWGSSRDAGYRIGVDHLRDYIARVGHANVPDGHVTDDGFGLGKWVADRRQDHKVGRLSTARIVELNALEMVWGSPRGAGYRIGVDHLRAYTATEGHANVPQRYVTDDGFKLGNWMNNHRRERRAGTLSAKMIAELNVLGMVWGSTHDADYRIGMDHLRAYITREGHANVPSRFVIDDGFRLGGWVSQRRVERRIGTLSVEKIAELNALGMVWDARAA